VKGVNDGISDSQSQSESHTSIIRESVFPSHEFWYHPYPTRNRGAGEGGWQLCNINLIAGSLSYHFPKHTRNTIANTWTSVKLNSDRTNFVCLVLHPGFGAVRFGVCFDVVPFRRICWWFRLVFHRSVSTRLASFRPVLCHRNCIPRLMFL